jgi:endonuclease/exonuclease/phosphatase (EEP) superfamily protein YafD
MVGAFSTEQHFLKSTQPRRSVAVLIGTLVLILQGCIEIPDPYLVIGQRNWSGTVEVVRPCGTDASAPLPAASEARVLSADGFTLVNWNMYKGSKTGWEAELDQLIRNADVVILQEAYLNESMTEALRRSQLNWGLATAFRYRGIEAGVLTASRANFKGICMQRYREPVVNTPKTSLLARFRLSNGALLMVVNIHAINFTVDTDYFRETWQGLEEIVKSHDGPLIVAGDFNTWSASRQRAVESTAQRLELTPVNFTEDQRTRIMDRAVDHVYYRDLVVLEAIVLAVQASDHNAMRVTFKQAGADAA